MSKLTQSSLPLPLPSEDKRPLPEIVADGNPDPEIGWPAFPLAYHDVNGKRYYAIQDWIRGVAQTENPRRFWSDLKKRLLKVGIELHEWCRQLPYVAHNDKTYYLDHAQTHMLSLITQHMHPYTGIRNAVLGLMSGFDHNEYHGINLNSRAGYVYLLSLLETPSYVKIGKARDLKMRVAQLDIVTPFTIVLKHSIFSDDCIALEKALHRQYANQHVKGEWFTLSETDIEAIRRSYSAQSA